MHRRSANKENCENMCRILIYIGHVLKEGISIGIDILFHILSI